MVDLERLLMDVAQRRADLREAEDAASAARMYAEQTPEWLSWQQHRETVLAASDALDAAETAARIEILAEYERTKNKAPVAGAGVRVLRKASYVLAEALAWCKENAPALLTVDEKKFVKADLDGAPITWLEVPTATIATDLSMYEENG